MSCSCNLVGVLQEAEALQREMQALEAERAGLLRDVQLKEEMEAQYAKRGTLQAGAACSCCIFFRVEEAGRMAVHASGPRPHLSRTGRRLSLQASPRAVASCCMMVRWSIAGCPAHPPGADARMQAREIRSARTKITSLEKGLVRMAADFEQARPGAGGGRLVGGWQEGGLLQARCAVCVGG